MKKIFLIFVLSISLYAGTFPYCDFENTSQSEIIDFEMFLNKKTTQVTKSISKIIQLQDSTIKELNLKIKLLQKIKKVLGQTLILKEKENFKLQKIISLSEY